MFLYHPEDSLAHDVEGLGPLALPDHGLPPGEGSQADPPGQFGQSLLGEVLEHGERIDQPRRLHPPPPLDPEPGAPPRGLDPPPHRLNGPDRPSDQGVEQEQPQEDQDDPGLDPPVPQREHQAAEQDLPEEVARDQQEDRPHHSEQAVNEQADVLTGESLAGPQLVQEVMAKELHGPRAEVGDPEPVREHEIPVELEERDDVQEDVEVGEDGVPVQRLGDDPLRVGPRDDGGQSRADALRVGPREGLEDPLARFQHEAVGGLHVEGGAPEVDHEPRALQPPSVVHQDQRVAHLVDQDHEVLEPQEDDEAQRQRLPCQSEELRPHVGHEGEDPRDRDRQDEQHEGLRQRPSKPVLVEPLHGGLRVLPLDGERRQELAELLVPRGRVEGPLDRGLGVLVPVLEEILAAKLEDEVGHPAQVHLAQLPEPLDHDLLHRPGPVHELDQLVVAGLDAVVDQVPWIGQHVVVLARALGEALDLDVGRQGGPVLARVHQRAEALPHGPAVRLGGGEVLLEQGPDVGGRRHGLHGDPPSAPTPANRPGRTRSSLNRRSRTSQMDGRSAR